MKKLCAALFALVVMAGCGSSEPKTVVCKGYDASSGMNSEIKLEATGDTVNKQYEKETYSLAKMGILGNITEEEKTTLINELKSTIKEELGNEDIPGLTYDVKIEDKNIVMTFDVDFDVVDIDKLDELELTEGGFSFSKSISLEKTMDGYKESGLTCTEEGK